MKHTFIDKKIKVFYGNEPILETKEQNGKLYGLHRDRDPDAGWGEWRWTSMEGNRLKEVEMNSKLRKILIEDICALVDNSEVYDKLKEFGLIYE